MGYPVYDSNIQYLFIHISLYQYEYYVYKNISSSYFFIDIICK